MLALLALLPILTALVLMVAFRVPATRAMPLAWLVAAGCAFFGWDLKISYIAAMSIHGAITAVGVLIILATRIPAFGLKSLLAGVVITFPHILGYENVNNGLQPLYLPGTIPFMLVALLTIIFHGMPGSKAFLAWKQALVNLKNPAIALIAATALVSIFRLSEQNPAGLPSMPMALAEFVSNAAGSTWPMFAGFVGGLGSFITGSNTISDLLFGEFQWGVAESGGFSRQIMVAAQGAGGAFGNMVCINNVVAVCAVVGLVGMEGDILKKTVIPFVFYGLVVGCMVFILLSLYPNLF